MDKRDLNEPAFPIHGAAADHQFTGLTLRDYFAGQALIGLLASQNETTGQYVGLGAAVSDAFTVADQMLKERQK